MMILFKLYFTIILYFYFSSNSLLKLQLDFAVEFILKAFLNIIFKFSCETSWISLHISRILPSFLILLIPMFSGRSFSSFFFLISQRLSHDSGPYTNRLFSDVT